MNDTERMRKMAEIKDLIRMCNVEHKRRGCFGCPLEPLEREMENEARVARRKSQCLGMIHANTDEVDRIVTEWCKEHPQKTYAQDFFEKFPNAPKTCDGLPEPTACAVYGDLPEFEKHCDCDVDCVGCWKEVIPDA